MDTVAVVGITTEEALQELRHQRYEREIDRETGEISETATSGVTYEQIGSAWACVRGSRRNGLALLRVELSLPVMLYGQNATALPLGLLPDAIDAALVGLTWELPDVPVADAVRLVRLDLASNYLVESVDTVLRSLSSYHVPHARHHGLFFRADGQAQTLVRGSTSEYLTRGYGKGHLLAKQANLGHEHADVLAAWAQVSEGLLRWELELRRRRLARAGITTVADLRPGKLEALAYRYFQHTRYDATYGGQDRVKTALEKLRPQLRPAEYRSLLTYLFEQEHRMETSLGRNQLERVRPLARRHNLMGSGEGVTVERRLDFDTGTEISV